MKCRYLIFSFLLAFTLLAGCTSEEANIEEPIDTGISLEEVPSFSFDPYVEINNNVPNFDESDLTTESYEYYSDLDSMGRCGVCSACVGMDIMPTEERGAIGMVKPTGWHTVKYDCVDGKYLYNRCHLIGYQLTGENANKCNLITGTRYLNVDGMLPFENQVADFVESTGYHVLYRVTPVYQGNNAIADGVLMEALSVEDNGAGLQFCVYCYNAQPGVVIDYSTGESWLEDTTYSSGSETVTVSVPTDYVLNTNTEKFHTLFCSAVDKIDAANREDVTATREEMIARGYEPCGMCKP